MGSYVYAFENNCVHIGPTSHLERAIIFYVSCQFNPELRCHDNTIWNDMKCMQAHVFTRINLSSWKQVWTQICRFLRKTNSETPIKELLIPQDDKQSNEIWRTSGTRARVRLYTKQRVTFYNLCTFYWQKMCLWSLSWQWSTRIYTKVRRTCYVLFLLAAM